MLLQGHRPEYMYHISEGKTNRKISVSSSVGGNIHLLGTKQGAKQLYSNAQKFHNETNVGDLNTILEVILALFYNDKTMWVFFYKKIIFDGFSCQR